MIKPVVQNEAFLAEVAAARRQRGHLRLWWLGQSGFLVQWQEHHLLLDPYLSDSLTRKYAGTNRPHVRMTERIVAPEKLDFVQVVTSSHMHTDHLDPETLLPLMSVNPGLILAVPEANRSAVADRLRVPYNWPHGLDAGRDLKLGPFTIHAVPAAHVELERDELGRHKFLGYVVEAGPWTLYHSGDTVRFQGMETILQRWSIDVAILPINGHLPERGVPGNLSGAEAARLAKDIGARLVVPCHFDMFEFNTVSPDHFLAAARHLDQPHRLLRCGEQWSTREL